MRLEIFSAMRCQVFEDRRAEPEPRRWLLASEGTNGDGSVLVQFRLSATDNWTIQGI